MQPNKEIHGSKLEMWDFFYTPNLQVPLVVTRIDEKMIMTLNTSSKKSYLYPKKGNYIKYVPGREEVLAILPFIC